MDRRIEILRWWDSLICLALVLSGIMLFLGGIQLALLGGSLYYLVGGAVLILSGVLLWRRRLSGAWVFGLFFFATLIWTVFEAGTRIWGWIPRMFLVAGLAIFVSLMLPRLRNTAGQIGQRRTLSLGLAGASFLCILVAAGLAFRPQNYYLSNDSAPDWAGAELPAVAQDNVDWVAYGGDKDATRYSPLRQINGDNVNKLKVAWAYRTGDLPPAGKVNKWAAETTPLKLGDGVYLCSATNNLSKLDPVTGKPLWTFDAKTRYESVPYTAACRGVTYYEMPKPVEGTNCQKRIIQATLDMRLIAVDAGTGELCQNFGDKGQVSLLKGLGKTVPGFLAVTSPPPIVNGVVVVNHQVLDGQKRWAPSGVIRGYDAETGAFRWAWDVNRPGQHGEPGPSEEYSRGTPNSWAAMTGDDGLGLVYVPMGNSAADYFSAMRSADENRVASSVVALDAATGEERWVYQTVRKDVWDYDLGSQVTLIDFPTKQGAVPAMIVPTKRGQLFVLDRRNGKPLTAVEDRPATQGNVPGDPRAETQPWSIGMPRLGLPDMTEKTMWGMTPFDQLYCRIKFKKAHYVGEFTPPMVDKSWIEYPGYNGGSDWGSVAYDPYTGMLVANWNNTPMYNTLLSRKEADKRGLKSIDDPQYKPGGGGAEGPGAMEGTPYGIDVVPFMVPATQMLCNEPPYGMITGINMRNQQVVWQRPLGDARQNGPFGIPTHVPMEVGTPNNGGPIITAGGLAFVAATTDNMIRAIDLKTGKTVWSATLPTGGQATPMTYSIGGKQYLVIVAAGHHFMRTPPSDYIVAFALPD
ncbi:membrane-bound PQQ-dependent dehydrogenase, glucose/quinate/shikimate family (plasmid) [Pseudomonas yamanorum]|nr:membrane-bound PQQ-dependent dehydrogenase, glucose/quinate/shikimate family [Pseudomonas yamanorum]